MKRKIISLFVVLIMVISLLQMNVFATDATAQTTENESTQDVVSTTDEVTVLINGEKVNFDVQPTIIDGRTLVPMRAIFENLGASVEWDGNTKTVTSTKDGTDISISIGDNVLYINNVEKTLDVPAMLLNGRTLVPVRAISEAFNCQVDWDATTRTVKIVYNDKLVYEKFVDFVKTNGSINESGAYSGLYYVNTTVPDHTVSSGEVEGRIGLLYDPTMETLQLKILRSVFTSEDQSWTIQELLLDLPKKKEKYRWEIFYYKEYLYREYEWNGGEAVGTLKANVDSYFDSGSVEITRSKGGPGQKVGTAYQLVGTLMEWLPLYGNNIFSENGSTLSLGYFGIL